MVVHVGAYRRNAGNTTSRSRKQNEVGNEARIRTPWTLTNTTRIATRSRIHAASAPQRQQHNAKDAAYGIAANACTVAKKSEHTWQEDPAHLFGLRATGRNHAPPAGNMTQNQKMNRNQKTSSTHSYQQQYGTPNLKPLQRQAPPNTRGTWKHGHTEHWDHR